MAEATSTTLPPRRNRPAGWLQNPVTVKELRGRMRGRRAFAVLTLYLLVLGGVVLLVYLGNTASAALPSSASARTAGKSLFAAVLGVQVMLVAFIGPAFTAGAISGERERQTFDLLQTTLLSPQSFVRGKLVSALSYVFLLVLVSIPVQSIAFLLGGLALVELLLSQLVILVAAVAYALYGLWCSAVMRSTLTATVATFSGMVFLIIGLPIVVFVPFVMLGVGLSAPTDWPLLDVILLYGGLFLAAINLPATLILSETFYLQDGTLLGYSEVIQTYNVWIFSPWWVFIILHVIAAVILYVATVRRVRRVSDV
jgi:ABC-type transport system involved in multi-copper enzyme maturation permease subunit